MSAEPNASRNRPSEQTLLIETVRAQMPPRGSLEVLLWNAMDPHGDQRRDEQFFAIARSLDRRLGGRRVTAIEIAEAVFDVEQTLLADAERPEVYDRAFANRAEVERAIRVNREPIIKALTQGEVKLGEEPAPVPEGWLGKAVTGKLGDMAARHDSPPTTSLDPLPPTGRDMGGQHGLN